MTTEVQKYAPIILEEIKKAKKILVHCHPSPDPDSVGGALATYHVLKGMGKDVTIIRGDSTIPEAFGAIPGVAEIVPKNFFEVDLSAYDLFIIQDSSNSAFVSKLQPVVFPPHLKTIVIDHHATTVGYADINLIDAWYPSVCQELYDLYSLWGVEITHDIAACLFIGMYTDTGGFKYPATKAETFAVAYALVKRAPDYHEMIFHMENSKTPKELAFIGLALNSIHQYYGGKVALAEISNQALLEKGIAEDDIQGSISNMLRSVIGWDISITLTEKKPGIVSLSFRTRDANRYDVSKIAQKVGGGGHVAAAGATINMALPEAVSTLLKAVTEVYPELGQP